MHRSYPAATHTKLHTSQFQIRLQPRQRRRRNIIAIEVIQDIHQYDHRQQSEVDFPLQSRFCSGAILRSHFADKLRGLEGASLGKGCIFDARVGGAVVEIFLVGAGGIIVVVAGEGHFLRIILGFDYSERETR